MSSMYIMKINVITEQSNLVFFYNRQADLWENLAVPFHVLALHLI